MRDTDHALATGDEGSGRCRTDAVRVSDDQNPLRHELHSRQGRPYDQARTNVDVLAVLDTEPEPVKTVEERVEPIRACVGN